MADLAVGPGVPTPLRLKPLRMKNSLYLLIPKGVSELLELDEHGECVLTTEKESRNPVLKYTFQSGGTLPREPGKSVSGRRHPSRSTRDLEAKRSRGISLE